MSKLRVDITREFACSSETLFEFLAEHESLARLFAPFAKVIRLNDGLRGRNDVGSARRITVMGVSSFVETYTRVEPSARIEYVVSGSALIKDHRSTMEIGGGDTRSTLRYTSRFDGALPLAAFFIGPGLRVVMQRGFDRLAALCAGTPPR